MGGALREQLAQERAEHEQFLVSFKEELTQEWLATLSELEERHHNEIDERVALLLEEKEGQAVAQLQGELEATRRSLAAMFKKYQESEKLLAFNRVDANSIRQAMLNRELETTKTELQQIQQLAEERVAEVWAKLENSENENAELQEELLTLRIEVERLREKDDTYGKAREEQKHKELVRRIALNPHEPTPTYDPVPEVELVIKPPFPLEDEPVTHPEPYQVKVSSEDHLLAKEVGGAPLPQFLTEAEQVEANPFLSDYDPNEDDQVRFFSEPLVEDSAGGVEAPAVEARGLRPVGEDRLFPNLGEFDQPVEVEVVPPLPQSIDEMQFDRMVDTAVADLETPETPKKKKHWFSG